MGANQKTGGVEAGLTLSKLVSKLETGNRMPDKIQGTLQKDNTRFKFTERASIRAPSRLRRAGRESTTLNKKVF